jgi:hypothetical protein
MLTFTVYEPPKPQADRIDRAESLAFVKDGFGFAALLFAPLWLLVHRLWWPLLGYVLASVAFEAVKLALPTLGGWMSLALVALHLLIGLEASTLRQWSLARRGWHMLGTVSGRNAAECERRFYEAWLPTQPVIAQPSSSSSGSGSGFGAPQRRIPVIGSLLGARS